jgi:hypothetical protein
MTDDNAALALAFPAAVRDDALRVASVLPEASLKTEAFSVHIGAETVLIPYRIYHAPALINPAHLTPSQMELMDCLLTRHHSGFVREKHLKNIVDSHSEWVPPFVVQLLGEYVIEILDEIWKNAGNLDPRLYGQFLTKNPLFFALTKQRVASYWDCYHRSQRKEHYAGFKIAELFDRFVGIADGP